MGKKNYYAVKNGRKTGIFRTWNECKEQIQRYSGAVYKSFETLEEAEAYMGGQEKTSSTSATPDLDKLQQEAELVAFVDGSYNKATGKYGSGCVLLHDGQKESFSTAGEDPDAASIHNVAGEIQGALFAANYAKEHGFHSLIIAHDYTGVAHWALGDWKANNPFTRSYQRQMASFSKELDIRFLKVPAHTGVELNEEADHLAKKAAGII